MDNNNEFGWVTEGNNGNEVPNDGSIDLSKYAPKNDPKFTTAISMGRRDDTTVGNNSVALGLSVEASGSNSHAEGVATTASAYGSHAEGFNTTASGLYSHVEGYMTTANGKYQHVQGVRNIEDTENKYAHIVGNGNEFADEPSNAHTLDWDGNAWFAGNITIGEDNKELATQEYVDGKGLPEYKGTQEEPIDLSTLPNGWCIVKDYYKWYPNYANAIRTGNLMLHKYNYGTSFVITYMNGMEMTRYVVNKNSSEIKPGNRFVCSNQVLERTNTTEFTPTADYHPATKKYVDDAVSNGGGGGSTPDWNQNDETQSDYIKNRTHYTTEPQLVPFKNIIINLDTDSTDSNNQSYYIWGGLSSDYLVANKEYKVDYNGTIYTCTTKQDPSSSYYYCIGNAYLDYTSNEDTGEPFFITTNKTYVVKNNTKVHDIKVCEFKAVDVQIDEKYLNNSPGKKVGGKTFVLNSYTNETAVAEEGAEIFNDYIHNIATGGYSHAEGYDTRARGYASHSEGFRSIASGGYSHAEGYECQATAICSHAEGYSCYAQAEDSHAEGYNTIARARWQHVEGAFNEPDPEGDVDDKGKYVHIVGNGYGFDNRSNAYTLDWKGNGWFAGNVSVDGTPTNDNDLTTKKYVDEAVASVSASAVNAVSTEYVDGLLARIEALEKIVADLTNNNE